MGCINGKFLERKQSNADINDLRHNAQSITTVFRVDGVSSVQSSASVIGNRTISNANNNKNIKNVKRPKKFDPVVASKYDFKKLLGEGTLTRVWMVEDRHTRQPYAIKIADDKSGRDCVDTEIIIMSRLRHPNVVHFIEVFTTSRATYMVMELATGGDLFDRIESQGPFREPDAVRIIKMLLEGVKYLHKCGITHRDLKLDNLLFYHPGRDSKLMIADFVLAVRPDRTTKEGGIMNTQCGTPEYLAPEVVVKRPYTSAVDMWAVGVVTYTVLSSTFPFDSECESIAKILRSIVSGKYSYDDQVWAGVSKSAKNFIDSLLVIDPKCRLNAVKALNHPWIHFDGKCPDDCDNVDGLRRTISSGSSMASSSSSSGRMKPLAMMGSSRRNRKQRRNRQREQREALENDPEWNRFRQNILASVSADYGRRNSVASSNQN